MNFIKSNILSLITLVLMISFSILFYEKLPESVATKFDFSGNPTQYSSKEMVVSLIPLVFAGVIIFLNVLLKISPQKFSMEQSRNAVSVIFFAVGLLLLSVHIGIMQASGNKVIVAKYFSVGVALFLIIAGNVFGKTQRNFNIGIRVPWTIASDANWRATHRLAGKLMFVFGILLLATIYFYSSTGLAIACLLAPVLLPVIYSYRYYVKNERGVQGA